jgi:hypothetical protein
LELHNHWQSGIWPSTNSKRISVDIFLNPGCHFETPQLAMKSAQYVSPFEQAEMKQCPFRSVKFAIWQDN